MKKTVAFIAALILMTAGLASALEAPAPPTAEEIAKYKKARATIETRLGKIVLEFLPDKAPLHVKNFITLAESGFYNGTPFHRVIPGFMIQGGDPSGNGTGGPGYNIKAEFNDVKHVPGVLSMARRQDPDSAGSQFFIMVGTSTHLDGQYSAFGRVVEGQEVADKIAAEKRNRRDKPLTPVEISVTITYGD